MIADHLSGAADVIAAGLVLVVAYCLGGLHGLLLAWSQEARMHRWAGGVHRLYMKAVEAEERMTR